MKPRTVLVCSKQVPLHRGGLEALAESLVRELRVRGHRSDLVTVPFGFSAPVEVLKHALIWRLVNVTEAWGAAVDLVIATAFPSYFARHPNKVIWLAHQYRQVYDQYGHPWGFQSASPEDDRIRATIIRADQSALREAKRIAAISKNVAGRLLTYNGIRADHLYVPPPLLGRYRCDDSQPYVLSVGRLDPMKRIDLLIRAFPRVPPPIRCVIAGQGDDLPRLKRLAESLGIASRVQFTGWTSDEDLIELYAGALAVYFAPFDEDYGLITIEAFSSSKPVITAKDSGGVLEFVEDGTTGLVCESQPDAIAEAISRIAAHPDRARGMGHAGRERVQAITWDRVIDTLLS